MGQAIMTESKHFQGEYSHETFRKTFARGNQVREQVMQEQRKYNAARIPINGWNALLEIVTDCVPVLRFGWLVPKYKIIYGTIVRNYDTKIFNIYPVDIPDEIYNYGHYAIADFGIPKLHPIDWLNGEPPTVEQVEVATREILDSETLAKIIAYSRILNKQV